MRKGIHWLFSAQGTVDSSQAVALLINGGEATAGRWPLPAPNELDVARLTNRQPQLESQYLSRRLLLRALVAQYLGVAAADVSIDYGPGGALALVSPHCPLFLSASQRGNVAGLAIAPVPVGIDVEVEASAFAVPWNVLSKTEKIFLQRLNAPDRHRAFLRIWTVKEAYLKAIGAGLLREPSEISVMTNDTGRIRITDRDHVVVGLLADRVEVSRNNQHVIATCVVLPPK